LFIRLERDGAVDTQFINELRALSNLKAAKVTASKGNHHDQINANNGVFAAERRVQPRMQQGGAASFDQQCRAREQEELARGKLAKERQEILRKMSENKSQHVTFDKIKLDVSLYKSEPKTGPYEGALVIENR
jgi:hypothetical protein